MSEVLTNIFYIAIAISGLLFMITVHEFGHYIAGKLLGFKINEFSIGFGPALYKKQGKSELFSVRLIPLGGYCAFYGEDTDVDVESVKKSGADRTFQQNGAYFSDGANAQNRVFVDPFDEQANLKAEREAAQAAKEKAKHAFNNKHPFKRIIVLLAGVTANFVVSLLIVILLFSIGGFSLLKITDVYAYQEQETVGIAPGQLLQSGDLIYSVEGNFLYVSSYDLSQIIESKKLGDILSAVVLRQNDNGGYDKKSVFIPIRTYETQYENTSSILEKQGIGAHFSSQKYHLPFFEGIGRSVSYAFHLCGVILSMLFKLITFQLPLSELGGPVATISATASVARNGFANFALIIAMMGINLAVFNALPFPSLDGCRVLFCIVEWVRKKPLSRRVEGFIHTVGIVILFAFVIIVDLINALGLT